MGKLDDLQQKRFATCQSGDTTARERIAMLFDAGSFVELDAFVKNRYKELNLTEKETPAEGVITGYGTVDGRLVYAYSQDASVMGGSIGEMGAKKICKVMDMAVKMGAPIVAICDSNGARLEEGVDALYGFAEILNGSAKISGVVPQISVILGACAGGAAFMPAMSDFVFVVDNKTKMFLNAPSVVGKESDEFGTALAHAEKTGVASVRCKNEADCFAKVKGLIGYLPSNNLEMAPLYECDDNLNRLSENLNAMDYASYNMKAVIAEIVDNGQIFEIAPEFAKNIITCFARLNGATVGIVANQPAENEGLLDINASLKGARFVRFCDSFNIPVVTFTDAKGYVKSEDIENNGIIRHGAKLLYAFAEATVPKVNVIVKKAYGTAFIAMNSSADITFAYPTAEIAVMDAVGAANIMFKDDVANSSDPVKTREEKMEEYIKEVASPYVAASRGYVDDVIEPDSTRPRIISALEMLLSKRESRSAKKHGNIPL